MRDEITGLFDGTGDGVFIVDQEQRIIYWNRAATELLGYSRSFVLGKHCWKLLLGHTPEGEPFCRAGCQVRQKLRAGLPVSSFDLLVRHHSGKRVRLNLSTIPVPPSFNDNNPDALIHIWRLGQFYLEPEQRLHIFLLGATAVRRSDGSFLSGPLWNRVKVRALLAYLALQNGRPVSRERLIETLWPDMPYKTALNNLNTTIYHLRRSLEPTLEKASQSSYINYHGGQYSLIGGDSHWIDVRAFEERLREARLEKDPARQIEAYQAALELYQGDYLDDLDATGVWSVSEQQRLQNLYLQGLETLADLLVQSGRREQAEAWYQQVLAVDPCRERAARRLIRLLMEEGRDAEALAYCRRLAATLEAELDVMLSEETQQLMAEIRRER